MIRDCNKNGHRPVSLNDFVLETMSWVKAKGRGYFGVEPKSFEAKCDIPNSPDNIYQTTFLNNDVVKTSGMGYFSVKFKSFETKCYITSCLDNINN